MDKPFVVAGLLQRGRRAAEPLARGHLVWRLPADVDTEALAPGRWMKYGAEVIAQHCLEALQPQFALQVRPGDVIVAGTNFGIGSSRDHGDDAQVHQRRGGLLARRADAEIGPRHDLSLIHI